MPAETTLSASMSRPESVSSRIAILGLSSSSCRISCRFFSPPEKPSFRFRCANDGSIDSWSMASRSSLPNVRIFGASPRTAVIAVRRKFDTETPGTSTGYCMARNSPARALASTLIASTSSPSSVIEPWVTVYFGMPGDRVRQRGLARAVRPHDRVRLPGRDGQVDAAQHLKALPGRVRHACVQVTDL